MNLRNSVSITIIALMFIAGAYVFPSMPEIMATHWDINGNADGYSSRTVGIFLFPVMTFGIYLLFLLIPKIAVYKKNIQSFYKTYSNFIIYLISFMAIVYAVTLLSNLGYVINMNYIIMPALGLLFYGVSFLLEDSKKNFFIGIRTPWTLSSDKVWEKTHKLGAKIFRVLAVLAFATLLFPNGIVLFIIPTFASVIFLIIYSYIEYQKENNDK
ncbi:MAG: SdpI family protein [Candidatus Aenigmarchaeota archaeon]|nr:SdpI family protein [Candidatus Aenigmarchaeota archaeon]